MDRVNSHSVPPSAAELHLLYNKIERLDSDLKEREVHLAELIDEVVYAEEGKAQAVRRAEEARYLVTQLETLVQDLLGYVKVIEENVLLPAFLELTSVVPQEPVMNREAICHTLQNLSEDGLSTRTKKLITAVRQSPSTANNLAAREVFMRNMTKESVNIEDGILLCGLLMKSKNELRALMRDLSERVHCILQGQPYESLGESNKHSVSTFRGGLCEVEEIREQVRCLEKECDDLRDQISVNGNAMDVNRLLREERKAVDEQLLEVHNQLIKEQNYTREMKLHVETLEQALEQFKYEKGLLQREIGELRRDQVNRNRLHLGEQRVEAEVQPLRSGLDGVIPEPSGLRTALASQLADLKAQNTILFTEKMEYEERSDRKDHQIAALQKDNDGLKRELFEVQQKMLSGSSPIPLSRNNSNKYGSENIAAPPTIDWSVVERRLEDASSRFETERKQIVNQFDRERERHKTERRDCDALVERMTTELEEIAMENCSLRASVALQ